MGQIPLDKLVATYPTVTAPARAEKVLIDRAIGKAIIEIDQFLDPAGNGGAFLDAVFGTRQRSAVMATYRDMQKRLATWRDTDGMVKLSGWMVRFGREAHTNSDTRVVTLPSFVAPAVPAGLGDTLIHESTHGANPEIVDDAYGGVGFRTMPGPRRPFNAPYFDYAVKAWRADDLAGVAGVAGDPNTATGAAVGIGAHQEPVLGVQFQRAQAIITHARIHAENMLKTLVDLARDGEVTRSAMSQADGLPLPILPKYWASVINTEKLSVDDIEAADRFVAAVTALHNAVQAMTYQVQVSANDQCHVAGNVMTLGVHDTNVARIPIKTGDLTADPWVSRIVSAILTARPPAPASGVTLSALGKVDQQYHTARTQPGHL